MEPPQTHQAGIEEKKGITWKHVRIVFVLLLIGLAILIAGKNAHPVEFWLFKWFDRASLILLMLISMLLGGVITWIIISVRASRKRSELRRLRNEVQRLREELRKVR
jgi:uncharacterized integral membrane protein